MEKPDSYYSSVNEEEDKHRGIINLQGIFKTSCLHLLEHNVECWLWKNKTFYGHLMEIMVIIYKSMVAMMRMVSPGERGYLR